MDKQNLGVGISQRRRPEPDVSVAVSHERGAPRAEGTAVRNHRSGATNARRRGTSKETARKDVEQPREQLQAVKRPVFGFIKCSSWLWLFIDLQMGGGPTPSIRAFEIEFG